MFENWNGLGIFTHTSKIKRINDLLRKYDVNYIAGYKTRVDWRFAKEEEQQQGNIFMPENRPGESRDTMSRKKTVEISGEGYQ